MLAYLILQVCNLCDAWNNRKIDMIIWLFVYKFIIFYFANLYFVSYLLSSTIKISQLFIYFISLTHDVLVMHN